MTPQSPAVTRLLRVMPCFGIATRRRLAHDASIGSRAIGGLLLKLLADGIIESAGDPEENDRVRVVELTDAGRQLQLEALGLTTPTRTTR